MRRILVSASIVATALSGFGSSNANAICLDDLACAAQDTCTGVVNYCAGVSSCSGTVNICPGASSCTGGINLCNVVVSTRATR